MEVRMSVEPIDEPVRQGHRTTLVVQLQNPGPDLVVLDDLRADGPHDDVVRWRRAPDGAIVYDAVEDNYRHVSVSSMRSPVPLDHGLLPARATSNTFLHVKTVEAGPRRVKLVARGHRLPADAVRKRVYAAPDTLQGTVAVYELASEVAQARGGVIVRRAGLEPLEVRLEVDLVVEPDTDAPSSAALAVAGPGARIVDRLRRLGGAWIVEGADGALHVVKGARSVRCPRGSIHPDTWRRLDEHMPFDPVVLMARSDGARAALEGLPLQGRDPQFLLPSAGLWDLLERVGPRGLTLSWGMHSALNDGLVVR